MNIRLLQKNKISIVFEALLKGILVEFKKRHIFLYQNCLYETFYSKLKKQQITRQLDISLKSFLNYLKKIDNKQLKRIYGDIKLYNLAKKLIKNIK